MQNVTTLDVLWILIASALVFVMRVGFAMLESGMTRSKNSINVSMKVLTDLGVSLLAYWFVGFGLMFGTSAIGLVGTNEFFTDFKSVGPALFFLFHAMFTSTSATIVSGAVAERIKFSAYLVVTLLFSALVYPVLGHWVWGGALTGDKTGWLVKLGFTDFAGGAVVHATGGWISLAALLVLGPRIGRYNADGSVNRITGAGLQTSIFGTLILWFGWFGFNGGSTLTISSDVPAIILNTSLGGAAGMIVTLLVGWKQRGFPDTSLAINGALAGLVSVTAGCPYFGVQTSILIGAIGGMVMLGVEALLDKLRIDDAVTAIPVHLGAGLWGVVAVGLFGNADILHTGLGRVEQTVVQLMGAAACGLWAFGVSFTFIWTFNKIFPIRVSAYEEAQGLNVIEHRASTEIYDLYKTLEEQARSGDLSLRAPVEPFTEVGQIAGQYNKVMDNLQSNLVAKTEYMNILNNVHEGLFLLGPDGRLGPFYSSALEEILETDDLAGRDFTEILEPMISPNVLAPWKDFQEILFDAHIDEKSFSRLNPLRQVELWTGAARGGSTTRHAQFQFRRIVENSIVVRVMVILRDVSEEMRLQKTIEHQSKARESEMELFYKILHLDPALLSDFLKSFDEKVAQINLLMETGQNTPKEVLKHSFRLLHGIKGEAALLELDFITQAAHELEETIVALQKKTRLENSDFLGFALKFGEFQELSQKMANLVGKLAGFQKNFIEADRTAASPVTFVARVEALVQRTCVSHGKRARLDASEIRNEHLVSYSHDWQEILIQLVRNAVVHGIETPEIRSERGKDETGTIKISTQKTIGGITVFVWDDGNGLDLTSLRQKALEAGWQPFQLDKWTKTDYVRFLFTDGISTAALVDADAGRGVGLSLVSKIVKSHSGKLTVRFESKKFLEFQIYLPNLTSNKG